VAALARDLGLSERQLHRRCTAAVGYGPKTLDRVMRFRRFLALAARQPQIGLADLAAAAGYADQAHLTRECGRLGGVAPSLLVPRLASAA
jgi:transcriptional regulator GlxA family with amidase domain